MTILSQQTTSKALDFKFTFLLELKNWVQIRGGAAANMGRAVVTRLTNRTAWLPTSTQKREVAAGVYIVGAGPGDPELLTVKAAALLGHADVVLYDYLVNPAMLKQVKRGCQLICVGKRAGAHSHSQASINQLLVQHARPETVVVRLKGGDTGIFARVAEECDALNQAGIDCTIVPGITAASGFAAYAGYSLSHRECAQSVRFVTATNKAGAFEEMASTFKPNETLVVYMGRKQIPAIRSALLSNGADPSTPVAIAFNVSLPDQRVFNTDINNMQRVAMCIENGIQDASPCLIVVGNTLDHPLQSGCNGVKPSPVDVAV